MKKTLKKIFEPAAMRMLLAREWLESGVAFNPTSPKLQSDPYPIYRKLRQKDPVHRSRLFNGWVLSKHTDIDEVLRDFKRFINDDRNAMDDVPDTRRSETHSMLFLDPPDHTRLRSLVSKAFTPRAIQALKPRIEEIVDELLDALRDVQTFDVMDELAYPLPVIVIAEMLGIPAEDRDRFKVWSSHVARTLEPSRSKEEFQQAQRSSDELREYLDSIIQQRRARPRDDLISSLSAAEDAGDKLTHEELLVTLTLLLIAGNETTKNLIGNGLLALIRHPDQMARLRHSPELIEPAVEELLRFDSPVQIIGRTALEDMEIGGKHIKRGQVVLSLAGSANRDPDAFSDPDRLDLSRGAKSHMSFGRGIHHCLGAPLARVEGQIAFHKLLERTSEISLDSRPEFRDQIVLRGLKSLRVRVKWANETS